MSSAADTVFTRIVRGEIPAQVVYEDEAVLAFLDISPLAPGHTLLIPKQAYATMADAPAETAAALGAALPRLVRAVQAATGAAGVNILQNNGRSAGQEVNHIHFHIIPRVEKDGLGYRWNPGSYASGEAEAMQARVVAALRA